MRASDCVDRPRRSGGLCTDARHLPWRAPMDQQRPSRTAIRTAVQRAAHLLLDDDPKILADTFARAFAGYANDAEMLDALDPTQLLDSGLCG
jgi:O-methyltransferase involved in polyketide biosynthesis